MPGASSTSRPQEDGKKEMWRWAEEGEHYWRGESGRRIRLGKNREGGGGGEQPGLGAYWVKENKTCHLAKERT